MTWVSKTRAMYQTMLRRDPEAVGDWPSVLTLRVWVLSQARPHQRIEDAYWACTYCRRLIQYTNLSLDHTMPLQFGGGSQYLNMQLCCDECNQIKDTLPDGCMRVLRAFVDSIPDVKPRSGKGQSQREAFVWRLRRPKFRRVRR